MSTNPFEPLLTQQGIVILDGALATALEERGADLNDPLWSAKLLVENPALIRQLHDDYLAAGADIIITASYQASFPGFQERGLDGAEAAALMRLSVTLAIEARTQFLLARTQREAFTERMVPLVAASIGPYGAYLHDGSEYTGLYDLTADELIDWHRPRLAVLASAGADLLACETIPSLAEAEALVALLAEYPQSRAWLSFSCRNGDEIASGDAFSAAVALADRCEQIVAVGVNCTAPRFVESLLAHAHEHTVKPLVVYPNRGEHWDAAAHCWLPGTGETDFAHAAERWYRAGARLIGGCCRTTPQDIAQIRAQLTSLIKR